MANNSSHEFWFQRTKDDLEYYKKAYARAVTDKAHMKTNFDLVKEFDRVFETPREGSIDDKMLANLRYNLMKEELGEVFTELFSFPRDKKKLAKELADLLYVVYGTAYAYNLPIDAVFKEVHRSNMSKVGLDGTIKRREDGKVLKGPDYRPPQLEFIFK